MSDAPSESIPAPRSRFSVPPAARPWLLLPVLIAAMLFSLTLGRYPLDFPDLIAGLLGRDGGSQWELVQNLVWEIRLPRVLAAVLIGMALAVSGAAFQSMFMNPLVSPGVLGVLSGAGFGAALGMVISGHWIVVQILAFGFGVAAVGVALLIGRMSRANALILLILGGIISGAFFNALLSVVKYVADPYDDLPAIVYWLMGSLAMVDRPTVLMLAVPMLIGTGLIMALARPLNALSMGEDEARSLGIPVRSVRLTVVLAASMISALTVVMGGMIGWVGLVVPHIARLLVGPDNRLLIPTAAMLGGLYLLLVDNVSRLAFSVEIPIGILTALIGIPFFAWALRNVRKGWG
ncbi:MAG TPA: iron ABC transporter permease [Guyparkeria sp.]|nr:iron ABC transporter permease [Guyparkeria sp.]